MNGSVWQHLEWLSGSPRIKPDWRLRRAEYLLATRGRFDRRIDDELIKHARTDLAKKFRCDASPPARSTTIQSVHELSRTSDSPLRWRLEAYLLTDLSFREIGEILKLDSRFVTEYHNLVDGRTEPLRSDVAARQHRSEAASTQSRGTDHTASVGTCHTPGNPTTRTKGCGNGAR